MFDRVSYKINAKRSLIGRKSWPVMMTFLILLFNFSSSCIDIALERGYFIQPMILWILVIGFTGSLNVAQAFVYLKLARTDEKTHLSDMIAGLDFGWLKGFAGIWWASLWIFLWSLLFLIPGIIKSIAYSQIFWILADSPEISVKKALTLSKKITKGHKWDIFVMGLSFVGWYLVSIFFTFGILLLWLVPYVEHSFANAYLAMKDEAIAAGRISPADFS